MWSPINTANSHILKSQTVKSTSTSILFIKNSITIDWPAGNLRQTAPRLIEEAG